MDQAGGDPGRDLEVEVVRGDPDERWRRRRAAAGGETEHAEQEESGGRHDFVIE
jgi:hypothetical protein